MNLMGVRAIYVFELSRWFRTLTQSLLAPVISTSLYFVVFGSAIGSRMSAVGGVPYGAFIIPGLIMLSLLTESVSNAAFGIHMPKWSGTICSRSQPSAQIPITKPNRLKVSAVRIRKAAMVKGWAMWNGTKIRAVARMIRPRTIDLLAAAPT